MGNVPKLAFSFAITGNGDIAKNRIAKAKMILRFIMNLHKKENISICDKEKINQIMPTTSPFSD